VDEAVIKTWANYSVERQEGYNKIEAMGTEVGCLRLQVPNVCLHGEVVLEVRINKHKRSIQEGTDFTYIPAKYANTSYKVDFDGVAVIVKLPVLRDASTPILFS
jgi:hypothetical protein